MLLRFSAHYKSKIAVTILTKMEINTFNRSMVLYMGPVMVTDTVWPTITHIILKNRIPFKQGNISSFGGFILNNFWQLVYKEKAINI